MSETGFHSLPTGKLHKKPRQSRLKNFPTGYVGSFYKNLADNVNNFLGSDFYGRIANDATSLHRTFRSIYLRLQISQRGCKMTSIIM